MTPQDRRIALYLGLVLGLFYLLLAHGNFSGSDEVGVFETTRALWEERSLEVPPGFHVYRGADGGLYNHFAIAQSVLALPFYGMGKLAGAVLPTSWVAALAGWKAGPGLPNSTGRVEIFAVSLYSQLSAALLVALFYLLERRLGVSQRGAVLSAVLLGSTTYVVMMSAYFLRHTTETIAILAALYGFVGYRDSGSLRDLALGSAAASATFLIRVPAAVAGPALAIYLLFVLRERLTGLPAEARRRAAGRALGCIALPLIAALLIHAGINHAKWGHPWRSPMLGQSIGFVNPLLEGLRGFLLSPGCSIFVYSPLLLLLPWTLTSFFRARRAECVAVLGIVVSFLLVCSKYQVWTGLLSAPGPRYLFVATPLLLLAMGPWLDRTASRARWVALASLGVTGLAVQLLLTTARWPAMVKRMGYARWAPDFEFVWLPEYSPLVGAVRTLAEGRVDNWLWVFSQGWPGRDAHPGVALLLLGLWALAMSWASFALRRAVASGSLRHAAGSADPGPEASQVMDGRGES